MINIIVDAKTSFYIVRGLHGDFFVPAGPSDEAPGHVEASEAMWDFTDIGTLIPPDGVVLDIGAGVGSFAVAAANRVGPRGVVCCTELSEGLRRLLELTLALNGLERVVRLDDRLVHEARFRVDVALPSGSLPSESSAADSSTPPLHMPPSPTPQSIGFDAWAEDVGCANGVDFVKVGCDGPHGPTVVIDSSLIERFQPFIYFHSPTAGPLSADGFDPVASYLDGLGYRLIAGKIGRRSADGYQRLRVDHNDLSAAETGYSALEVLAVPSTKTVDGTGFDTWLADEDPLARIEIDAALAGSKPEAPERQATSHGVAALEETWN